MDVLESDSGSTIQLRHAGGVFLEVPPDERDEVDDSTVSPEGAEQLEAGTEESAAAGGDGS